MQFELNHNVTEQVCKVTFKSPEKIKSKAWRVLDETFQRLGANQCDDFSYLFPSFIRGCILEEIINNTCFVCGGLMKDSTAMLQGKCYVTKEQGKVEYPDNTGTMQVKVRKCSSCGHSHT